MNRLEKVTCFLVLMTVVLGQSAVFAQQPDEIFDPWLNRARLLTNELVKDCDSIDRYDRALLLAWIGKMWQQDDAEQARKWIEQAIREVESAPDKESATEHRRRLSAARNLLVILGAQDKALSERLNKVLSAATETTTSFGGSDDAHAKAEAGLAVVDSDPQRALQFGLASVRAGGSYKLARLIWRLRKRDVNLSDILFTEINAAARARNYDQNLLATLPGVTFEGPSPSDKLRGSFLSTIADGLLRPPSSAQEQTSICRLSSIAAPLLPEFQRLLPQQADMVRAQITVCQENLDPNTRKEVSDALQPQPIKTVDDLLWAASQTSDLSQRVTYLNRAAYMTFNERKYERAIAILDGFSEKEREFANKTGTGLWDNWRSDFASSLAAAHLKRGDYPMMYRAIVDTPPQLRTIVKISVAAALVKKDHATATQLLDEARIAIPKTSSTQDFGIYLSLVRLYATLNSTEALSALRDAVKTLNEMEKSQESKSDANDVEAMIPLLSNEILLARYKLPASLLAMDETSTRLAIAAATSPTRRAAMRLNLLEASLTQRRTATPKPTTKPKGQNNARQQSISHSR